MGLGIGIIASMAYDEARDTNLRLLPSTDLFPDNTTRIAARREHYLRGYVYRFIEECAVELTESMVKTAIAPTKEMEID